MPKASLKQGQSPVFQPQLVPAGEISFWVIAGRNILFSAATQTLVEINDTAAYIWRAIELGLDRESIFSEMVEQGLSLATAESYFDGAILEWTRLGFVKPSPQSASCILLDKAPLCQDIRVAGVPLRIRYATDLTPVVAPIFEHLESQGTTPDIALDVVERDRRTDLFRNGSWLLSCSHEETATVLKGQLLNEVLEGAVYELALHAAALVRNGCMLLISGHPGAGKTTLTLALVDAGFGFAGDDLALLNSQGRVTGVPFAPAVKAGAWKLVATCRPDIHSVPVFRRPDRKRVRYPAPRGLVAALAYPVGWLVLLDRSPGATAALTPVDPISAVRWILQESYAQGRQLTTAGFKAIGDAIDRAKYYRLTYSRLEDAVELLDRTCR
jgi:hypothetical protein